MFPKNPLAALTAAIVLGVMTGHAVASERGEHAHGRAQAHDHGHAHDHGATKLSLNKGRKWATDEALRTGMSGMRAEIDRSLHAIHEGRLDAAGYEALAKRLEGEMAQVVANCKLAPEADAQLHLVLAQLGEGVDAMKAGSRREDGAATVVQALNAYGRHFSHPGWKPIRH